MILVGKSEGKRPLGTPRHRRDNDIKMDLRETGWDVMNWIHVTVGRNQCRALVKMFSNMFSNLQVP
jgi:hypothetical protein